MKNEALVRNIFWFGWAVSFLVLGGLLLIISLVAGYAGPAGYFLGLSYLSVFSVVQASLGNVRGSRLHPFLIVLLLWALAIGAVAITKFLPAAPSWILAAPVLLLPINIVWLKRMWKLKPNAILGLTLAGIWLSLILILAT
jgi:hypothetical protein